MNLLISSDARADLLAIGDFIARDNPDGALEFTDDLLDRCMKLAEQPRAYRLRSEWGGSVRAGRHGAYMILFELDGDELVILRVIHGKRDIDAIVGGEE